MFFRRSHPSLAWLLLLAAAAAHGGCEAFVTAPRRGLVAPSQPHIQQSVATRTASPIPLLQTAPPGSSTTTALRAVPPPALADAAGGSPLLTYFLQTLIANGVPAAFAILVIGFTAWQFRGRDKEMTRQERANNTPLALLYDDLYGDLDQDPLKKNRMPFAFPGGGRDKSKELPKNTGVPKQQYLKITNLNSKYDSYRYSLTAATQSKAAAAAQYRRTAWERAMGRAVADGLGPAAAMRLQELERDFLAKARNLQELSEEHQAALTQATVDSELKAMGMESVYQLDPSAAANANATTANATATNAGALAKGKSSSSSTSNKMGDWVMVQQELQKLELDFVKQVVAAVGPEHAAAVRTALLGGGGAGLLANLSGGERPLAALLGGGGSGDSAAGRKRLFVTRFPGDTTASQVSELREAVTGVARACREGDEALVILQTGGGTVTGYGLAAAQLMRLKEAGLKLTIAVEQVAASVRGNFNLFYAGFTDTMIDIVNSRFFLSFVRSFHHFRAAT